MVLRRLNPTLGISTRLKDVDSWESATPGPWLGVCDSGSAGLGVQGWRGGTLGPRFAGAAAAARFALAALQPQQKSDRDISFEP